MNRFLHSKFTALLAETTTNRPIVVHPRDIGVSRVASNGRTLVYGNIDPLDGLERFVESVGTVRHSGETSGRFAPNMSETRAIRVSGPGRSQQ